MERRGMIESWSWKVQGGFRWFVTNRRGRGGLVEMDKEDQGDPQTWNRYKI